MIELSFAAETDGNRKTNATEPRKQVAETTKFDAKVKGAAEAEASQRNCRNISHSMSMMHYRTKTNIKFDLNLPFNQIFVCRLFAFTACS